MTTTKERKKTVAEWCGLFAGTRVELAARLGVTRMVLWKLQAGGHHRCPFRLLRKLAGALKKPADGSRAPTAEELVAAWKEEHDGN